VLTVGGVAWANGSETGSAQQQKGHCPKTRPHSGWMHHGTAGKVMSVSATSITMAGRDGTTQTIKVDASTKVYAGREEAKLADIRPGWLAFVETGSDGVATVIRAVDPAQIRAHAGDRPSFDAGHMAGGKITAVSATSITLTGRDGTTQTVKIDARTTIYAGREQARVSALKTGWLAFVQKNDAGVAVSIRAADPAAIKRHFNHHRFVMPADVAAGKIASVTGSSITLQSRDGETVTVEVNGSTKVFTHGGAARLSSLKTGWVAFVIRGKDGIATVIHAADPSQFGHHGEFGQRGDDDGGDAPTSTNASF
jgi:Cu/Ag efflux protein CusF